MESLTVREIVSMINAELLHGDDNVKVTGISSDSRNVKPGDCFVALKGEFFDGHNFIADAIQQGASAILLHNTDAIKGSIEFPPVMKVPCTFYALEDLARKYCTRFSAFFIAITGSVGKTTTKDITAHILEGYCPVLKSQKSFNNSLGVPLTLMQLEETHRAAVIEMGTNAFGEIRHLTTIVNPHMSVLTCISDAHLQGFGDVAGVAKAKSEILENMQGDKVFVTNADDPACMEIAQKFSGKVVTFAIQNTADYKIESYNSDSNCIRFELRGQQMEVPIFGAHHLYNVLAGIAIANSFGVPLEVIKERLKSFTLPPMRMQIDKIGSWTIINDAYNSSPKSLMSALSSLEEYPGKRKIAILGSMLELGETSEKWHYEIGCMVAKQNIDELFVVEQEAYPIAEGALSSGMSNRVHCFADKRALLEKIPEYMKSEDVILLKASRGAKFEEIHTGIQQLHEGVHPCGTT